MKNINKIFLIFTIFLFFINHSKAQNGWYNIPSGTNAWLKDVKVVDQNNIYIVGLGYTILKSTNLGNNWIIQYSGANYYNFYSVSFINVNTGFAAGGTELPPPNPNYDVVFKTVNGGNTWNQIYISNSGPVNYEILAVDSLVAFKINSFSAFITTDGGFIWNIIQGLSTPKSIFFTNASTGFIVSNTQVSRTTNKGLNWVNYAIGLPAQTYPQKIYFSNLNTGYIVGNGNGSCFIIKTTNSGINWSAPIYLPNITVVFSVYCISSDTLFVTGSITIGDYGRIFKSTDGGQNWALQYLGTSYTDPNSISFLNSLTGFTVGPTGLILKTTTGGENIIGINKEETQLPRKYTLSQNYPNPFNPTTTIKFDIPKSSHVQLVIYDLLGREVIKLVDEQVNAGTYKVEWNASNYASGLYFYKLTATAIAGSSTEDFVETKKLVLLK